MNGRERVLAAIAHRTPDRIPRYDAFWEETVANYERASGMSMAALKQKWGFDIVVSYLDNSMRMPVSREDLGEEEIVHDRCGYAARRFKGKATLHYISHAGDAENWPELKKRFILDPRGESRIDADSFFLRTEQGRSWEQARQALADGAGGLFRLLNFYGPFEATWRHHGYEQTMVDCLEEPELMADMAETVVDLTIKTLDHALHNGFAFDGAWMVEDLGCTRGLLISRSVYRSLVFPQHRRLGDFFKARGLKYFIHSCGDVREIIPDMLEAGVDVLQPLQANTSLRLPDLRKEFPEATFWGNVDPRKLAGSKEEIKEELRRVAPPGGVGGGYIYHSDHSVPPDVGYENYEYAMKCLDAL